MTDLPFFIFLKNRIMNGRENIGSNL